MPDATGLELIAQDLRDAHGDDAVLDTTVLPRQGGARRSRPRAVRETLELLRERGFGFLASVHGVDYYPEEPRLGVHYELLDMTEVDRITVQPARPARRAQRALGDAPSGRPPTTRSARSTTCSA